MMLLSDLLLERSHWKAFTKVFAGFALTLVSLPNITFTHAFVAGLLRVLMRQIPGSVKMPVFFTSFVARAAPC